MASRRDGSPTFEVLGDAKSSKFRRKIDEKTLEVFQITLGIDFLWILERFWFEVGSQNAAKIDIKGCWKNDEKMMMTKMTLKSHMGDHEWERNLDFGARGGGRRRGKPLHPNQVGSMSSMVVGMMTSRTL